jgi:hypothetical protein
MPLTPPDVTSSAAAELPQQRLLTDLQQLVRPRHARWDELGLMSVRSFVLEELARCQLHRRRVESQFLLPVI